MSFGELQLCLLVGVWSESVLEEIALGSMQDSFYNMHDKQFMTSKSTSTNLSYENVQDSCEENIIKTL